MVHYLHLATATYYWIHFGTLHSRVQSSYFALTVLQCSPLYNTVRGSSLLIARLDINVHRNGVMGISSIYKLLQIESIIFSWFHSLQRNPEKAQRSPRPSTLLKMRHLLCRPLPHTQEVVCTVELASVPVYSCHLAWPRRARIVRARVQRTLFRRERCNFRQSRGNPSASRHLCSGTIMKKARRRRSHSVAYSSMVLV